MIDYQNIIKDFTNFFSGINPAQIIVDLAVAMIPTIIGVILENKYQVYNKVSTKINFWIKLSTKNISRIFVQQNHSVNPTANVREYKASSLFGKSEINIYESIPKIGTKTEAKNNPESNKIEGIIKPILSNTQLEICKKVQEISKKRCVQELDISSEYERCVVEVNNTEYRVAASKFIDMYEDISKTFAGIVKGKTKKYHVEFNTVIKGLREIVLDIKPNSHIPRQIKYCEEALWRLILSF